MSKYYCQVFGMIVGVITISVLLGTLSVGWCQNQPVKESSIPLKKQKASNKMKTLKIQWQRLVIDDQTCQRCGATEAEVEKAFQSLKHSLNPLGIEVVLEKMHITVKPCIQIFARSKRVELLQQQGGNQGKQAHGISR